MKAKSLFFMLIASTAFVGCGPSYKLYPVTGKVTLDGAPLAGATVTLQPVGGEGKAASATCDKDGAYSVVDMRPEALPGAAAGNYKVGILWFKPSVDSSQATGESSSNKYEDGKAAHTTVSGPKSELPAAYQSPETSELTLTVEAKPNVKDFALDSKFKGKAK